MRSDGQGDLFAAVDWQSALEQVRDQGQLRDLDVAVARFLHQQAPNTDPAVLVIAALTSAQLAAGHLCLDLDEPELAQRLWPAGMPDGLVPLLPPQPQQWHALLRASELVGEGPGQPLVLDGSRLYLYRNWTQEVKVADLLLARLRHEPSAPPGAALAKLFVDGDDEVDWQQVACALATRARLTVITGGPGTGKTTTVVRLLGLLQSLALEQGRALRIRLAAPTGKAATRLTQSIGDQVARLPLPETVRSAIPTEVSTLHRLLGTRPDSRRFRHHRHNPLHADLVVVDEASMIDMEMMAGLLDALDANTRLVLLGDKDQLASVEAGAVLGDLCRNADQGGYDETTVDFIQQNCGADLTAWRGDGGPLAQQTAMLRRNWRFRDSPGIGALAQAVNQGDNRSVISVFRQHTDQLQRVDLRRDPHYPHRFLIDGTASHPGLKALLLEAANTPDSDELDNWAAQLLARLTERQLLSGLRGGPFGVTELNQQLTRQLHRQGLADEHEWYPGRPVMLTHNDYQLGLMNGDVGLTLAHPDGLRVAFPLPDGRIKWVLPSRLGGVETVYAMTVHKSQGSEFRHTLLILPDRPHPLLTRELIYTAVTRARETFTLLECGSGTVLNQAVSRRTWRASGLWQRLNREHGGLPGL